MNSSLIEKLTIVEFASVLAGPLTGTFFSELGATVIKIENPNTGGDITRSWLAKNEKDVGISSYYASANYGKQTVYLDLKKDNERDEAFALCTKADIVISNFKSSSAKKMGITYEKLKEVNPSIIFAELSGFPGEMEEVAFDILLQARTGYLSMTGWPEQQPAKIPVAMIDILASHQLREGVLLALMERMIDGKSKYVRTNLYDSALSGLVNQATDYLMNGNIPQKLGSRHPHIAPYGDLFMTKDKIPFVLAIGTDRKFERLLECLNLTKLRDKYSTNALRVQNRSQLNRDLNDGIQKLMGDGLFRKLSAQQIPHSRIYTVKEVFFDPLAKNALLKEEREGRECIKTKTVVFNIDH